MCCYTKYKIEKYLLEYLSQNTVLKIDSTGLSDENMIIVYETRF